MKENSREEDITKINTYVELVLKKDYCNCNELNTILGKHCDGSKNVAYAMQHILSDYKRVLKENEELNKKIKEQKECTFREDGTEECLWHCSNCHDEWLFYEGTPEENNLKYCPHCGAKVIKYKSYIETEIEIANKMAKDYLKESEE